MRKCKTDTRKLQRLHSIKRSRGKVLISSERVETFSSKSEILLGPCFSFEAWWRDLRPPKDGVEQIKQIENKSRGMINKNRYLQKEINDWTRWDGMGRNTRKREKLYVHDIEGELRRPPINHE
mmetsp:Transcript_32686/g.37061  ORF Transcript_32686/g.37061 Transcript_32686/m.37061 type:complete len:123 (-) Transcript_32686:1221-1589(-)